MSKKIKTLGLAVLVAGAIGFCSLVDKPVEINPEQDTPYRLSRAYGQPKISFEEVTGDNIKDRIVDFGKGKVYFIDGKNEREGHFRPFETLDAKKMHAGTSEAIRYQNSGQSHFLEDEQGW